MRAVRLVDWFRDEGGRLGDGGCNRFLGLCACQPYEARANDEPHLFFPLLPNFNLAFGRHRSMLYSYSIAIATVIAIEPATMSSIRLGILGKDLDSKILS